MKEIMKAVLKSKRMNFESEKNYYYMAELNLLEVEDMESNLTIKTNRGTEDGLKILFYIHTRRKR